MLLNVIWAGLILCALLAALIQALAPFAKPFFTLGREPLAHLDEIPVHQHWTLRLLDAQPEHPRARCIAASAFSSKPGSLPNTWLKRRAISRVISTCGIWSSPTGTRLPR